MPTAARGLQLQESRRRLGPNRFLLQIDVLNEGPDQRQHPFLSWLALSRLDLNDQVGRPSSRLQHIHHPAQNLPGVPNLTANQVRLVKNICGQRITLLLGYLDLTPKQRSGCFGLLRGYRGLET